jgi:filamentous hemagglutinin family protein
MTCIHRRNTRRFWLFQATTATRSLMTTAIVITSAMPVFTAYAGPTGGEIVGGNPNGTKGTIAYETNLTTITQIAPRIAINWPSFSSAPNETIVFNQPSTSFIALNRVTGTDPSQLMGRLLATGQVFILNPNGVLFGPSSQVNVRGLLASTLSMGDGDFMSGKYLLQGGNSGKVVNQGNLAAAEGGYVALVGESAINIGNIDARKGDVLLAAGQKVTLRLEGGSLLGYSVDMGTTKALAENGERGVISAKGGRVVLEAQTADILIKEVVNNGGLIEAQTLEGKAGSIKLIGDRNVAKIQVGGTLDVSAPDGGDGGTILASAAQLRINDGARITAASASGLRGVLNIESTDFVIAPNSGARSESSISAAVLAATLDTAAVDLYSISGTAAGNAGDLTVDAAVESGRNLLTLRADRNINFNAALRGDRILLKYGQASDAGSGADFYFRNGARIDLPVINSVLDGFFGTQKGSNPNNLRSYFVINSLGEASGNVSGGTLQGMVNLGADFRYVLGRDIDANATSTWNSGAGFTPLAQLNGTLEGLGHDIKNLTINRASNIGLFTSIGSSGQVRNLGLTNVTIKGAEAVGALAGSSLGALSGVHVSGVVNGTVRTGGLVGNNRGTISNSHSQADITGKSIAGGLTGENGGPGLISDSYASGSVSAGNPIAPVTGNGDGYAGGLAGYSSGTIKRSYASGSTSGNRVAGGLVGENAGIIEDSYAQGSVSGNSYVGGLAGLFTGTGTRISNAYATGAVQGIDNLTTHGLIGAAGDGTLGSKLTGVTVNSYWNTDPVEKGGTGKSVLTPGLGEGKTGAELSQAATFDNWDIATAGGSEKIWRIYEGKGMPLLRSFLAPLVVDSAPGAIYSGAEQTNPAIPTAGARTGTAASGRIVGTYRPYSNQQGYDISNGELVITPALLAITPTGGEKVYDGTLTTGVKLIEKPFGKDKVKAAWSTATFIDKNAGTAKTVTVKGITLSGDDAGNYSAPNELTTSANIAPRPIDITATAADKIYDGTTTVLSTLQDNRVAGDTLVTTAIASFNDKNAGTGKNVTVSGIALTGTDALNYSYQPQLTTTASITQRALDIAATAANKVYDGTTSALPTLQDNRVAGDNLVTSASASFDDKHAGAGKKVTVSGVAVAGADAGNYLYKPQVMSTIASITPRPLEISATAVDKAYDGTARTSATLADNRLAGDAVTASYQRAEFADKNGGQKKTVTVSGIALGGPDAPNYQANTVTTTSASINPVGLTIVANADTRLADGVPYQGGNGVTYAGFIPGETAAVLAGQVRYGGDAQGAMKEGVYRITPGGQTSLNYASTFVDGTLTIQPKLPGAGLIAAYTEPPIPSPLTYVGRNTSASTLRVVECGMRLPENLLVGSCLSASQPGSLGR